MTKITVMEALRRKMGDGSSKPPEQSEAEKFMSQMMSNLDGKKDAEIKRLRSALEHIIETWHCGDIKPEDIALCRAALSVTERSQ